MTADAFIECWAPEDRSAVKRSLNLLLAQAREQALEDAAKMIELTIGRGLEFFEGKELLARMRALKRAPSDGREK